MIRLTAYVILCVIASLVVALPTLALADVLTPSVPRIALKSTLPSLNDLSIPVASRATVATADAQPSEAQPFSPPPIDPREFADLMPAAGPATPAVATAPIQPAMDTPTAITPIAAPGPQVQAAAAPFQDVPAFRVSYGDIESAVSQALTEKGAGEKVSASINGRTTNAIFSYSKPMDVQIRGLMFDKVSGHWSANVLAMSGEEIISAMPASGHYEEMTEVPVLKRAIKSGEIIAETDVAVHDFPLNHVRSDTVTDIANLIGKSPLRGISPLRPIRMQEITEPAIIKKNAVVSMKYISSGMEISTSGQALEDGIKGGMIAVRNMTSKKIVHAMVEDASTVNVSPDSTVASTTISRQALNIEPAIAQEAPIHATN